MVHATSRIRSLGLHGGSIDVGFEAQDQRAADALPVVTELHASKHAGRRKAAERRPSRGVDVHASGEVAGKLAAAGAPAIAKVDACVKARPIGGSVVLVAARTGGQVGGASRKGQRACRSQPKKSSIDFFHRSFPLRQLALADISWKQAYGKPAL